MADGKLKILQMYGKMSKFTEHLLYSQPSQNFMESVHVPQGAGTDEPADRSKLIEIEKERRP